MRWVASLFAQIWTGASHFLGMRRGGSAGRKRSNALLAFKCCIQNNRKAEFLDWWVCRAGRLPKKWDAPGPSFSVVQCSSKRYTRSVITAI